MAKTEKRYLIYVQLLNILFAGSGALVKVASLAMARAGFFAWQTLVAMAGYVLLLGIYAFFWQIVIKKLPLSTAYLSKSLSLFWTLLFSIFLFSETVTFGNALGIAIIAAGTWLVQKDE